MSTPMAENASWIQTIIRMARVYNNEIGSYEMHVLNGNFDYAVKLSNGRLVVPPEVAQDIEKGEQFVTSEQIKEIANTFTKKDKQN